MGTEHIGDNKGYSERKFWKKVNKYAKKIGREIVEKLLILFYAVKDPNVPKWAKAKILGAFAYFISPLDAIPDIIPIKGFVDDIGIIVAAFAAVAIYLSPEIKKKAAEKVSDLFD